MVGDGCCGNNQVPKQEQDSFAGGNTLQKEINENASLLLRFLLVTDHLVTMARQTFKNKFNQKYALK